MAVRIVIAEDERLVALALQSLIESCGHQVVGIAGNGREALDLCRAQAPDVVLMDIRMPGMDGIETTRALMQESPTCVVVVSGNGQVSSVSQAEEVGAMDYVVKPLMASRINPVVEAARQRFDRFMAIRQGVVSAEEALDTWRAVRSAVRALMETGDLSEERAHQRLACAADKRGVSLRAAAEQVRADQPSQ